MQLGRHRLLPIKALLFASKRTVDVFRRTKNKKDRCRRRQLAKQMLMLAGSVGSGCFDFRSSVLSRGESIHCASIVFVLEDVLPCEGNAFGYFLSLQMAVNFFFFLHLLMQQMVSATCWQFLAELSKRHLISVHNQSDQVGCNVPMASSCIRLHRYLLCIVIVS